MNKFLVHIRPVIVDGVETLPNDLWEEWEADSEADAIARALTHNYYFENIKEIPSSAFVAKGKFRYKNGSPLMATRYAITEDQQDIMDNNITLEEKSL